MPEGCPLLVAEAGAIVAAPGQQTRRARIEQLLPVIPDTERHAAPCQFLKTRRGLEGQLQVPSHPPWAMTHSLLCATDQ